MSKTSVLKKFVRFSSVGATVFVAQEAFLWAIDHWTQLGPRVGFWAAWFPAVLLHFLLTKFFTFRSRTRALGLQILRYCGAVAITSMLQYTIYHLALKSLTPQPNLALAIAAALSTTLNFAMMKFAVFESKGTFEKLRGKARVFLATIRGAREPREVRM